MKDKQIKTKTKHREATEERLLLAAEQIFSKLGFKSATTRMIAKKADINMALINRYFDGKYGLLLKVLENKSQKFHSAGLLYPAQENLTDECISFAMFRFENMILDTHFFKIVMVQFLTDPKFLKKFQESLINFESIPAFEERLKALHKKGKIPNYDANKIFETINTQICGTVLFDVVIFKQNDVQHLRKSLEDFVRTYCQGLLSSEISIN